MSATNSYSGYASRIVRVSIGVSGIDPETGKPWPALADALAATERSREIAAMRKPPAPTKRQRERIGRNWATPASDAELLRMVEDGFKIGRIADRLGVAARNTVLLRMEKLGVKRERMAKHKSVAAVNYYANALARKRTFDDEAQ